MFLQPVKFVIDHSWRGECHRQRITVEASQLGPAGRPLASQLYDDAIDIGCETVNPVTGRSVRWYLHEELRNQEDDLLSTVFRPTAESLHRLPHLRGWELHIIND